MLVRAFACFAGLCLRFNAFAIVCFCVLAFAAVLFRGYRAKKASNKALLQKNEEILEQQSRIAEQKASLEVAYQEILGKNKRITQSINYAQRIQNAMMPKEFTIFGRPSLTSPTTPVELRKKATIRSATARRRSRTPRRARGPTKGQACTPQTRTRRSPRRARGVPAMAC